MPSTSSPTQSDWSPHSLHHKYATNDTTTIIGSRSSPRSESTIRFLPPSAIYASNSCRNRRTAQTAGSNRARAWCPATVDGSGAINRYGNGTVDGSGACEFHHKHTNSGQHTKCLSVTQNRGISIPSAGARREPQPQATAEVTRAHGAHGTRGQHT